MYMLRPISVHLWAMLSILIIGGFSVTVEVEELPEILRGPTTPPAPSPPNPAVARCGNLTSLISKILSAVALFGTDITTVIVYFLNRATPMAAFKHAPGYAATHLHVVEDGHFRACRSYYGITAWTLSARVRISTHCKSFPSTPESARRPSSDAKWLATTKIDLPQFPPTILMIT
jgi:hypothetical protein